jgi:hypothetical protein
MVRISDAQKGAVFKHELGNVATETVSATRVSRIQSLNTTAAWYRLCSR